MKKAVLVVYLLASLLVACLPVKPAPTISTFASLVPTQSPSHIPSLTASQAPEPTAEVTQTPIADRTASLERVAQLGGSIFGIAVAGDLAYVGIGPRVGVIDIRQPTTPQLVSQSEPLPGSITHLITISDEVLVVNAGKYLVTMDISDPYNLKPSQQLVLDGGISAMVFDDRANILYAGGAIYVRPGSIGYDGFVAAISLTQGKDLELIDMVTMPEVPLSLALGQVGLFAGAGGEDGGLYHLQLQGSGALSTPNQVIASTPESPLVPSTIQIIGERLYLGYWGVQAYDITNPAQPVKVWSGGAEGINIVTDFNMNKDQIYVTGFSIREPDVQRVGMIPVAESIRGSQTGKVASNTAFHNGNFMVAENNLQMIGTADPGNLQLLGRYTPPVTNAIDAAANEKAIFVLDFGAGDGISNAVLWVLGLPDLIPVGKVSTEIPNNRWGGFRGIAIEGDRVYLATNDSIWIYDISRPEPVLRSKIGIDEKQLETIVAQKVGDKRLLFTLQSNDDQYNLLWVYDLTDIQNPTTKSEPLTLDQGSGAQMTWTGSTLYIFLERSYFSKEDMLYAASFNGEALQLESSLTLTAYTGHMTAEKDLVVLTGTEFSMDRTAVSLVQSDPLKLLATQALPENGMGVAMIGDKALVVVGGAWDWGGEAQLLIFDLHPPLDLRQVGVMDIAFSNNNRVPILYAGAYIILVNGSGGVELLAYDR